MFCIGCIFVLGCLLIFQLLFVQVGGNLLLILVIGCCVLNIVFEELQQVFVVCQQVVNGGDVEV